MLGWWIWSPAWSQACHPDWSCALVAKPSDSVVLATVLRVWDPTDEIVVGYELKHLDRPDVRNTFHLRMDRCRGLDCRVADPVYPPVQVGDGLRFGEPLMPSLTVFRAGPGRPLEARVLLRDRWEETAPYCGSEVDDYREGAPHDPAVSNLDLSIAGWSAGRSTGVTPLEVSPAEEACADRGSPAAVARPGGAIDACWRYDDGAGGNDEIHCGRAGPIREPAIEVLPSLGVRPRDQDHAALALAGGERVLAHRSIEDGAFGIRVRFPDREGDPGVLVVATDQADRPDIAVAGDAQLLVAWQRGGGDDSAVHVARCDGRASDCTDPGDWLGGEDPVAAGTAVRWPQLAVDGPRQFLLFMENVNPHAGSPRHRVRFATRCGDGEWEVETIQEPADPDADQVLYWGHPHVVVDAEDRRVHVAWVEADEWDEFAQTPAASMAWRATRAYDACPR